MLNLFILFVVISFLFLLGIFVLVLSAPSGIENDKGFYYEVKNKQKKFKSNNSKNKYKTIKSANLQQAK